MKKTTQKVKVIDIKYEELEQYDFNTWAEEFTTKKEAYYASHIGTFLIWFSNLEHSLEVELANLINQNSHDQGYIVIKDLDMSEKVELFYNLLFTIIHFSMKKKKQSMNQLISIRKKLEDFSTLRNRIAHAKWNTLDKYGYVRVDAKTKKEDGLIKFKKLKITPVIMRQSVKKMAILADKLPEFIEKVIINL